MATYRDGQWFAKFTAATPELQQAMQDTIKARESLDLLQRVGTTTGHNLEPYRQRLAEAEAREAELTDSLQHDDHHTEPVTPIDLDTLEDDQ